MANTQAITFKRKLFLFAALTSGSGLVIAAAATLLNEWRDLHARVLSQVDVQADIIAANLSAAVSFDDSQSAVETLATFHVDPSVLAAWVCKPDESLFATYSVAADAQDSFQCGLPLGHTFANRHLKLVHAIRLKGETIGTVIVDYGLDVVYKQMFGKIAMTALILGVALVVAQFIAAPVRSALLRPVTDLAQAARAISDTGNYDTRVTKQADDELGHLADAFNLMVGQVQNRDTELRNARDELEHRVGERTAELAAQKERLGDILRDVDAIVWEADPKTWEFTFVSERAQDILGYPVTQWLNDRTFWANLIHPQDRNQAVARWVQGTDGREDHSFVYRAIAADGRVVWLQDVVRVVCGEQASPVLRGLMIDITERKRNEALKAGHNRILELLTEGRNLSEVLLALVNVVEAQAPTMRCTILLLDEEQRLRIAAAPSFPDEYNNAIDGIRIGPSVGSCGTAAYLGERVIVEDVDTDPLWENYRELGRKFCVAACWSEPIRSTDGRVLGTLAMYYSHSRRPEPAELQLIETASHLAALAIERTRDAAERNRLALSVEATADGVVVTDTQGVIQYTNPALSVISGYPAAELRGARPSILKSGAHTKEFYSQMWQTIRAGQTWHGMLVNRRKDGSLYNAALTISPVCDKQNRITDYVGVQRDVTAEIEREQALESASRTDKLTGLPNRAHLHDRLQHAIELAKRMPEYHFAVMFLDLDRFKIINDSLGHEVGDMLLRAIASRLRQSLRAGDSMSRDAEGTTVSRLGGDEFVILLDAIKKPEDAATVAARLLKDLEAPYQLGEHEVHSTASIG
ncbi:MAG: diguanylate cyclase, partial [Pseudomonadota bacterium]